MAQKSSTENYVNVKGDKNMKGKNKKTRSKAIAPDVTKIPSFDELLTGSLFPSTTEH